MRIVSNMQHLTFQDVPLSFICGPAAFTKTLTSIQMGWPVLHAVRV